MSIRNILIHPDPRLKKIVAPVPTVNDDIRQLADDMLETMYDAPGIGLAAPQIAVNARMLVMDCAKDAEATPEPMVLINPQVIWSSVERSVYDEGCLSVPGFYETVERPSIVEVAALDREGRPFTERLDGLMGICLQHEIDHLEGKLFVDYLSPLKRQRIRSKLVKEQKRRS